MKTLQHKFVEFIPDIIEEEVIYISLAYCTAIHKCICGCGNEVVTPISPTDWQVTFDGMTITLRPSIGNWSFPCRSHYWIINSRIKHAKKWSDAQIGENRDNDVGRKARYYTKRTSFKKNTKKLTG